MFRENGDQMGSQYRAVGMFPVKRNYAKDLVEDGKISNIKNPYLRKVLYGILAHARAPSQVQVFEVPRGGRGASFSRGTTSISRKTIS